MTWPADLVPGSYRVILADPAWRFRTYSAKGDSRSPDGRARRARQRSNTAERHYKTMTLDEIKALPVGELAARDCVLLLWVTDPFLAEGIKVGEAWGFAYKTVGFYWAKLRRTTSTRHLQQRQPDHKLFPMGTGYYTRANPELCLLFTRGSPSRRKTATAVRKLMIEPRQEHSRKPVETRIRIEKLMDGPYIELFARNPRAGWHCWGDQLGRFNGELL